MKVFGCEMQGGYAGGIILVAARSVDEAFEVASANKDCGYLFFFLGAEIICDSYPKEKWHEFEHLSCDYTEPQVILEESHAE